MHRQPLLGAAVLFLVLAAAPAAATDDLAFYPCLTPAQSSFVQTELGRGEPPARDPAQPGSGWDYAVVDLDNDGVSEVAVRPSAACEGPRCGVAVFTRINGRWVEILNVSDRALSVARQIHRGYRDVLSDRGTWRWSGRAYALVN